MRVVELVPSLHVGGAERLVSCLAQGLSHLGHDVAVVSLYAPTGSWIERELAHARIAIRFLGKRRGPDPRVVPRLARAFAELRPEVLHTHLHTLPYALPARVWSSATCPVVHTVHNLAARESEWHGRLVRRAAFRAGVEPVAIGDAVAASIEDVYGFRPRHVIPNGISVAAYRAAPGARDELRAALGLPSPAPVFLVVGRLDPQKDHATLLDAFADPALRDTRLLVAGDGELRPSLERRARRLGIEDRVHFLGVRADIPRLLAAADVFVLSSRWEGNPLVVMEAMAAGLPVVATAVGCVPDLVPPEAGRTVPPRDGRALAAAMRDLALDPSLRRALGAGGHAVARARFDTSTMARAYGDLFARLVFLGRASVTEGSF